MTAAKGTKANADALVLARQIGPADPELLDTIAGFVETDVRMIFGDVNAHRLRMLAYVLRGPHATAREEFGVTLDTPERTLAAILDKLAEGAAADEAANGEESTIVVRYTNSPRPGAAVVLPPDIAADLLLLLELIRTP